MKRSNLFTAALVLGISLGGFSLYQARFAPAPAPEHPEYLPPDHSLRIGLVSSARAGQGDTPQPAAAGSNGSLLFDFSGETVGAQPVSFTPAVGNWLIGSDGDNKVLVVDGRKWKRGTAAAGIADKARALYGKRYAEFLDNVKAYAYFPFAVAGKVDNFTSGTISLRFKAIAGRIDQGAGILFDLKTNGDYYALRANPLENNLVLWRFKQGRRSSVSWVRNVNTPSRTWHTLRLTVKGRLVKGFVNGKQYLAYTLPEPVSGKVGVWTKADSVVYFDDYKVEPE